MRIVSFMLLGLSLFFGSQAQAAVTAYEILFSATQGSDGAGRFIYDDTPGAERLSDITIQFGSSLNITILTITYPPPYDNDEFYLFRSLSNPDSPFSTSYSLRPEVIVGADLIITFQSGGSFNPSVYSILEKNTAGSTYAPAGAGTFQISAVPIPAALPLFGSALGLLGFIGWKKRMNQ